jgi:DNA topoisomerase IB
VDDSETLGRIAALAIPPAWKEVWVCGDPRGHLQATGMDAAGRKQYLYHERWRARRDQQKFDEMLEFARTLPRMRRRVARALGGQQLDRERVLACAVRLLDIGFFRVGGEEYADSNGSYGLTTILKRHVSFDGDAVVFDYPGKSGQRRVQAITDPATSAIMRALKRRRSGERLLAYRVGREWRELGADELNDHLKQLLGGDFSAKDFRTWNATVLAAVALATAAREDDSRVPRKRAKVESVRAVAHYLGNTPAVCRASYIDPRVFDRFEAGTTIAPVLGDLATSPLLAGWRARERVETAVVAMLEN